MNGDQIKISKGTLTCDLTEENYINVGEDSLYAYLPRNLMNINLKYSIIPFGRSLLASYVLYEKNQCKTSR
jgi:hypothetical protein